MQAGLLSTDGAEDNIRFIYESFLKKCPDCVTAEPARTWLVRNAMGLEGQKRGICIFNQV